LAFRGTFDFTLDAKNRLTVPVKFRGAFADGVVVACGIESCGALWRPADFEAYTREVRAGMHPLSKDHMQLTRFFAQNSWDTELDGAGRVNLHPRLIQHAGLGKEVVVAGGDQCLEIWDPGRQQAMNDEILGRLSDITARFDHTP
jgi:MraZ protein